MDDNVLLTIEEYYELKNKYEKKFKKFKRKIIDDNNLTKKEKIYKINEFKKCINCNKNGGTIFTSKNAILKAKCGNIQDPCNLNIVINRGQTYNVYNLYVKYNKEYMYLRDSISKLKLDFIFKYKYEDEINELFPKLKENLKNVEQQFKTIQIKYNNILNNNNKYKLNLYNSNLNNEIKEIDILNNQYTESNDDDYLIEIINKYKNILLPLLDNIRNIKYTANYIEYNEINNKYSLIQDLYNSENMEIYTK